MGHGRVLEHPLGTGFLQIGLHHRPKRRCTGLDWQHPLDDLFFLNAMDSPGTTTGIEILQQNLESVEGVGETGLSCISALELVPKGPELYGQVDRQVTKNQISGTSFALLLVQVAFHVEAEGIARLNFHNIVQKQHLQDS